MADRLEIIDALESLAVHCRLPLMDVDARSRWMQTWCEDLRDFPVEAIKTACRNWRQGEITKFPTPGQLLPMVRSALPRAKLEGSNNAPWAWPSDAELDAMPISEQRRNHLIMASQCRSRVGPMNADREHPRPEWLVRAAHHDSEVGRLNGLIARGAQKREAAE